MKKVLFVCIENSCRSQMAEGFARTFGTGVVEAYSAGSRPSGKVNEKAIAAMRAIGYDLAAHDSKSLDEIPQIEYDCVVTMGCGDACPLVRARRREDWGIPDPKNLDEREFAEVRHLIRDKVLVLIDSLRDAVASR